MIDLGWLVVRRDGSMTMVKLMQGLVVLAALGFIMAIMVNIFDWDISNVKAEGFSRASSNIALIAIALGICFRAKGSAD